MPGFGCSHCGKGWEVFNLWESEEAIPPCCFRTLMMVCDLFSRAALQQAPLQPRDVTGKMDVNIAVDCPGPQERVRKAVEAIIDAGVVSDNPDARRAMNAIRNQMRAGGKKT